LTPPMRSRHRLSPKPRTSTPFGGSRSYIRHCCQSVPRHTPPSLGACATGPLLGHEPGDGESAPTIGDHARSSSTGFLFEAETTTAKPGGRLAIMCGVGRFIGGQDFSLLPAPGTASPLQTPMAGTRSFCKGHPKAESGPTTVTAASSASFPSRAAGKMPQLPLHLTQGGNLQAAVAESPSLARFQEHLPSTRH
jgi:hypothetical protein